MHVFREGCPTALNSRWTHTLPHACSQSLPSVKGIVHSEIKTHPHLVPNQNAVMFFSEIRKLWIIAYQLLHYHLYNDSSLHFTFMHLADTFIQSDLQSRFIQSDSSYNFFCPYVCSLGIEPTTFCATNAMLYHWATGTHSSQWPRADKMQKKRRKKDTNCNYYSKLILLSPKDTFSMHPCPQLLRYQCHFDISDSEASFYIVYMCQRRDVVPFWYLHPITFSKAILHRHYIRNVCFTVSYTVSHRSEYTPRICVNILLQGSSNLSLEGQSAAEFSSNPDQTHYLWFSSDLEDSDYHTQVCLIRVRAKLCRSGPDLRMPVFFSFFIYFIFSCDNTE